MDRSAQLITDSPEASLEPPLLGFDLPRRLFSEALGTLLLLNVVIGSGIMAQRLAGGNTGIAMLGHTLAIGAGLVVLITIFGPISGAHFNPAVSMAFWMRRQISGGHALAYSLAQTAGAVLGVWTTHLMFAEPVFQLSTHLREGPAQAFSEFVATFGLMATIFGVVRFRPNFTPMAVGLYIFAACWFTASFCYVNPAVTFARSLSNTFAGISPHSVPVFILAQLLGAATATGLFGWLLKEPKHG
ncbi:MAG: major intrinsic protein (MIP)-family channel protein [Caulobacteraceae bacterium]|nr:major intrinsic protein (MIP)-family channel protein [Caulobacteraceae bacterium]